MAAGQILDKSLSWQVYAPGATTATTLRASDLFDCDGSKGINAIVLDESATWCGQCQEEAMDLKQQMTIWQPQGVTFVTLMVEDASYAPATLATAQDWEQQYSLTGIYVGVDQGDVLCTTSPCGMPTSALVDPRTMKIESSTAGYSGIDPAVSQLALKNK